MRGSRVYLEDWLFDFRTLLHAKNGIEWNTIS